ncbi:cytochrome P450 [Streptomyces sp. NPDC001142]
MSEPWPAGMQLVDPVAHADGRVERLLARMRREEPVARHEGGAYPPFWSVTRYDDVKYVYTQPEEFSSAHGVLLRRGDLGEDPGGGQTLALTDPPRHKELRRVLAPRFNESCARGFGPRLRADIREVLRRAGEAGEFDFAHAIAGKLSSLLIARLLGVPDTDLEKVAAWAEEAFAAGTAMTSHPALTGYVLGLMDGRFQAPTQDAVSLLAGGEVDGKLLSETEILLNIENLLGASENAGLSIAAGMKALLEFPEQWQAVQEDADLIPGAVEEILRWASSATHSMRTAKRDTELAGHTIRRGEKVVVWVHSANRDESVFDVADTFDVRRRPNRHLSLGVGEHVCIGQTMARHQMRIFLDELRTSVASFEQTGEAVPLQSIAVRGPAKLPMRLTLR